MAFQAVLHYVNAIPCPVEMIANTRPACRVLNSALSKPVGPAPTMKMYILIKQDLPAGHAVLAAAHASLAAYLEFQDTPEVKQWLLGIFYKVVCQVSDDEFEAAKSHADHVVLTESSLDDREVAIAFKPRQQWPKRFRSFRLHR